MNGKKRTRRGLLQTPLAQFTLLGLRGVLRERSVLFWSFLFPLLVTAIFLQAFSPNGRPEPFVLAVADLSPENDGWRKELQAERGVTLIDVGNQLDSVPDYPARLAVRTSPESLPPALRDIFFVRKVDALLTPRGFFSIQSAGAAARDANRILAAKARARGESLSIEPVSVEGVTFADWFAPGMIGLTVLTGGLFGTSFRLASDREQGLFRRYMLTPFRRSDYVIGFVLARGVFIVAQVAVLVLLFHLLFGFTVHGSLLLFFGLVVMGALASNLLGAAVASRVRKSEVAGGIANVFFFPMMFLSGVYFKTESFPPWLKNITDYFSLAALSQALRKVANEGLGARAVVFEASVLAAWIVVCLGLTVAFFDWGGEP